MLNKADSFLLKLVYCTWFQSSTDRPRRIDSILFNGSFRFELTNCDIVRPLEAFCEVAHLRQPLELFRRSSKSIPCLGNWVCTSAMGQKGTIQCSGGVERVEKRLPGKKGTWTILDLGFNAGGHFTKTCNCKHSHSYIITHGWVIQQRSLVECFSSLSRRWLDHRGLIWYLQKVLQWFTCSFE